MRYTQREDGLQGSRQVCAKLGVRGPDEKREGEEEFSNQARGIATTNWPSLRGSGRKEQKEGNTRRQVRSITRGPTGCDNDRGEDGYGELGKDKKRLGLLQKEGGTQRQ